jgi:hypothetical protein
MDCLKAVDKSNGTKRVVLNEVQPIFCHLVFNAFKQSMIYPLRK